MAKVKSDYQAEAKGLGITITNENTVDELQEMIGQKLAENEAAKMAAEEAEPGFDITDPDKQEPGCNPDNGTDGIVETPEDEEEEATVTHKECMGLFMMFEDNEENFPNGGDYSTLYYEKKGLDLPGEED